MKDKMRNLLPAVARCACVVSLATGAATCHDVSGLEIGGDSRRDAVSAMRIYSHPHTGDEKAAYTVRIDSPWPGGGQLHVNFPEHLEYGPVGYTITRYSDPRPPAWQVASGGKSARYDVESIQGRGVKGVNVRATACVVEPNRVQLSLTIANDSSKTLHDVKPLLCFQYKGLAGFPQSSKENFKYTYVVLGGRITALADVATENPDATAKAAPVQGVKPYRFAFSKKRGGYIDQPLDLGTLGHHLQRRCSRVNPLCSDRQERFVEQVYSLLARRPVFQSRRTGPASQADCQRGVRRRRLAPRSGRNCETTREAKSPTSRRGQVIVSTFSHKVSH